MFDFLHTNIFYFCTKTQLQIVQVIFISWIIIYVNYIFSLYAFPFTHSKDDDECGGNLTTNG
jgi:hypothetical protein